MRHIHLVSRLKTKIQGSDSNTANPASVSVLGNSVELVESSTYLGCRIDARGLSKEEIQNRDRQGLHKSITNNIWYSSTSPPCENITVQHLRFTGLTVRLRNVGHDGEVQQATRCVRSVVPSTHSTSPKIHCSCYL